MPENQVKADESKTDEPKVAAPKAPVESAEDRAKSAEDKKKAAEDEKARKEQAEKDAGDVETYLSALRGESLVRGADGRFDHAAFNGSAPLDDRHDLDGNIVSASDN